ncbi:hypothetical protein EUX98_g8196 [Antrodiella citrinella]|uniref:Uncharacterized protein n=1 Tax=Antrodiella citrinella TaxID=2447956 RepID=A0A4S4MCA0_9APHY|nr:hypothetical protein EUX98_g8196 [Antrodiella citrinella]
MAAPSPQADEDFILHDGFYADKKFAPSTIAPPIQIYHPVFNAFTNKLDDNTFCANDRILDAVSAMMQESAKIKTYEPHANHTFLLPHLRKILDRDVSQIADMQNQSADGSCQVIVMNAPVPLLKAEYKRSLGEGGCDPLTQAEYSVLKHWARKELEPIVERTCCPTFIIAGGGPCLIVMGAVNVDAFIVQRLTDLMWIGEASVYEDKHAYRIGRAFTAVVEGINELETFYKTLDGPEAPPPSEGSFPYPTSYSTPDGATVQFKYITALENEVQSVTFLAETCEDPPSKVVVKFVDRYGAAAHRLLADEGLAPKLRYFGTLDGTTAADDRSYLKGGFHDGPLRMVVMDYVEGSTAWDVAPAEWVMRGACR